MESAEGRGGVCDRGAGSFLVLCWLRKMAKAMEPAERLDFSRPPNPVSGTFGGMFVR